MKYVELRNALLGEHKLKAVRVIKASYMNEITVAVLLFWLLRKMTLRNFKSVGSWNLKH